MIRRQQSAIFKDLSNHLRGKLIQVIEDEADTARRINLTHADITILALRNLLNLAAFIAIQSGGPKEDFLEICGEVYDRIKKKK
jgi:hypothetical protein